MGVGVRERLLEAGMQSFHRHGFNGCGVQEITDLAGVPKGSFYNHFESKEALGAAVLDYYWDQKSAVTLSVLVDTRLSPLERLRSYFDSQAQTMATRDYTCGCLMANLASELSDQSPLITERLSAIFTRWTGAIAACIREAQGVGEVRGDVGADALAAFLLHGWEGAMMRARIEKDGRPLAQFRDMALTYLGV